MMYAIKKMVGSAYAWGMVEPEAWLPKANDYTVLGIHPTALEVKLDAKDIRIDSAFGNTGVAFRVGSNLLITSPIYQSTALSENISKNIADGRDDLDDLSANTCLVTPFFVHDKADTLNLTATFSKSTNGNWSYTIIGNIIYASGTGEVVVGGGYVPVRGDLDRIQLLCSSRQRHFTSGKLLAMQLAATD